MKNAALSLIAGAVVAATVSVGGVVAFYENEIMLRVDGEQVRTRVFGSTVQDVLDAHDIVLAAHDVVTPAVDTPIRDGSAVIVNYARPVTIIVNGESDEFWTTATTVGAALRDYGIFDPAAEVSEDRSKHLERDGLTIEVSTSVNVSMTVEGETTEYASAASTVADLIAELGIQLGENDQVSPELSTPLSDSMSIVVTRYQETTIHGEGRPPAEMTSGITRQPTSHVIVTEPATTPQQAPRVEYETVYVEHEIVIVEHHQHTVPIPPDQEFDPSDPSVVPL